MFNMATVALGLEEPEIYVDVQDVSLARKSYGVSASITLSCSKDLY